MPVALDWVLFCTTSKVMEYFILSHMLRVPSKKHERNYGISDLVWAVRYFHPYLLGHLCVVYTDHTSCLSILNFAFPSSKLAQWVLTIQEMDLTTKHKPGRENSNADTLSCNPVDASVACAVTSQSLFPETVSL